MPQYSLLVYFLLWCVWVAMEISSSTASSQTHNPEDYDIIPEDTHACTDLAPRPLPSFCRLQWGEPGDEAGQALQLLDARLIISFSHLSKLEFSAKSSPYTSWLTISTTMHCILV